MSSKTLEELSWNEFQTMLKKKSRESKIPEMGTFELTPLCNFNCKMCYVHLSPEEACKQGFIQDADSWIELGRQVRDAGTLTLLLTGGEVFTRPDFRKIYEALSEMGFMIIIYTNGYLIDESVIEWLGKRPPMKLRITMYGASNETYEKVTGIKNGYDKVMKAINLIEKTSIPLALAMTVIKDNDCDVEAIKEFAKDHNLLLNITKGILKSSRGVNTKAEEVRMDISKVIEEEPIKKEKRVRGLYKVLDNTLDRCSSHNSGYWVKWNGNMTMCALMSKYYSKPFESNFETAWNELCSKLKSLKRPKKCTGCKYINFCNLCPGIMESETGSPEETSDYLCDKAKALYKKYSIQYLEEGGI